jgi:hypothetical protein
MASRHKRRKTGKVVFVKANPRKRAHKRRRRNPAPIVVGNPRRRHTRRRRNPGILGNISRHVRRSTRRNPPGSINVGSNVTDGVFSLAAGGLGYFGALIANKAVPTSYVKYRGIAFAVAAILATWKIREKHLRMAAIGFGIEGVVDALKQNVSTFSSLSADDANEHLLGVERQTLGLDYGHGDSGLGDEGMDGDTVDGDTVVGASTVVVGDNYSSGLEGSW